LAMLGLAFASWFVWIPVAAAAGHAHPGFIILLLDALLSTIWVAGVQGVVFGLLPLRFLDGEKVVQWSRAGWVALYGLGMFTFVHTMLDPGRKVQGHSHSFWPALLLFLAFTLVSLLFWAYFRFRPDRADGPSAEERFEELV
ncbi:MAG TPA: hypothetical protein VGM93_05525, partial [Acidimicrobiales bacterium]